MDVAFGVDAIVSMVVHLIMLIITFWALQTVRWEVFFQQPKGTKAKVLIVLLTVVISSIVANFLLDYFVWSNRLQYLFFI
ncbi:DUF1146 family protein [Massilibacterium senegalense]|uniref:DUF1146 family protein n=1 Tax=Massilibacterium senegalense TaxID=1632858 RepID=UPI000783A88A|nr:DUF1146 family protein [Massilibacterium senegalense]